MESSVHSPVTKSLTSIGVTNGKNIWIAGTHLIIDTNSSALADLNTGHFCQCGFWPHTDGKDHNVGRMSFPGARKHFQRTVIGLLESCNGVVEFETYAVSFQVALDESCHFRIKWRHDLIHPFDKCHFQPTVGQVFNHLQADKTATDNNRSLRICYRLEARVRIHSRQVRPRRDPAIV